jgi:hypothetical protein
MTRNGSQVVKTFYACGNLKIKKIILYPAVEAAKTCPTIDWKGVLSFQEVSPDG